MDVDRSDGHGMRETRAILAYQSPPSPLLLASWVLPAAADAKLEGSGVGILKVQGNSGADGILHEATNSGTVRRETSSGGFASECVMRTGEGRRTRDGSESLGMEERNQQQNAGWSIDRRTGGEQVKSSKDGERREACEEEERSFSLLEQK